VRSRSRRKTFVAGSAIEVALSGPALAVFVTATLYPTLLLLSWAFSDKQLGQSAHWIGFQNIRAVLREPTIGYAVRNTIVLGVLGASFKISIGYVFAALAWWHRRSELWLLLPSVAWLLPGSIAAVLWLWLWFSPGGVIPANLGIGNEALSNATTSLGLIMALSIWREAPLWALVMYAARRRLPEQLSEDMSVNGITPWKAERQVFARWLAPFIAIGFGISTIWGIGEYAAIEVLTRGGSGGTTETLAHLAYKMSFGGSNSIGLAMACIIVALPIGLFCGAVPIELGLVTARRYFGRM
jgi:ABC-type sugar transport system permease subunit